MISSSLSCTYMHVHVDSDIQQRYPKFMIEDNKMTQFYQTVSRTIISCFDFPWQIEVPFELCTNNLVSVSQFKLYHVIKPINIYLQSLLNNLHNSYIENIPSDHDLSIIISSPKWTILSFKLLRLFCIIL